MWTPSAMVSILIAPEKSAAPPFAQGTRAWVEPLELRSCTWTLSALPHPSGAGVSVVGLDSADSSGPPPAPLDSAAWPAGVWGVDVALPPPHASTVNETNEVSAATTKPSRGRIPFTWSIGSDDIIVARAEQS